MSDATVPVDNPLLQAALAYAARGWPVFPCEPGNKKPLTAHGFKNASTDAATIEEWWARCPGANVAIATGEASGLYVVDEDAGGADTIAALDLPPTRTVWTPTGGRHYYFRLPEGPSLGNTAK